MDIILMCLWCDISVRQHYKVAIIPSVTGSHCPNKIKSNTKNEHVCFEVKILSHIILYIENLKVRPGQVSLLYKKRDKRRQIPFRFEAYGP